jgi:hypothetical protein
MAPNSASFCSTAVADMLTEVPVGESAPAMLSSGGAEAEGWQWRHRTWWGASSATSSGEVAGVVSPASRSSAWDAGSARGGGLAAGGPPSPCSWVCTVASLLFSCMRHEACLVSQTRSLYH